MSYAQNNLACASWRKAPEGWHVWTGRMSGYGDRGFCSLPVGHYGEHRCEIEAKDQEAKFSQLTWENKTPGSWPSWLLQSTLHALRLLEVHPNLSKTKQRQVRSVIDAIYKVHVEEAPSEAE